MKNNNNERISFPERRTRYKKKKSNWKWIVLSILSLLLIGGGIWATGLYFKLMNTVENTFQGVEKSQLRELSNSGQNIEVDSTMNKFTILFSGIDLGENRDKLGQTVENSRSDAMIVATVNMAEERIDLVNIPRDTLSYIDKVDYYDKINHSRAFGGNVKDTMISIENLLHVPIDYYVEVDFDGFMQVVDKLGGIDIDVKTDIWSYELDRIYIKQGYQTLNGDLALKYVRARAQDSDAMRGQRQLDAIQAIFAKVKQIQNITLLSGLIDIAGEHMTHNLTTQKVNTIITSLLGKNFKMYRHQVKGYDVMYENIYYYYASPTSLFEISTLLNYQLGLQLPNKRQLMNIRYSNYIRPLYKKLYNKRTTITGKEAKLSRAYLSAEIPADDAFDYLPETLNVQELLTKMSTEIGQSD